MWINPKDPDVTLLGNDSGFRVSRDGGVSWTRTAIPSSTFFDTAIDRDTPFRVDGSVQDHGSVTILVDQRLRVLLDYPGCETGRLACEDGDQAKTQPAVFPLLASHF
jgi:hypothetical protein